MMRWCHISGYLDPKPHLHSCYESEQAVPETKSRLVQSFYKVREKNNSIPMSCTQYLIYSSSDLKRYSSCGPAEARATRNSRGGCRFGARFSGRGCRVRFQGVK